MYKELGVVTKAIMISIRPEWLTKILNRDKHVEVRKGTALYKAINKLIEQYGYADIYVYCTKDSKYILIKLVSLFGSAIKWDIDLKKNQYAYKTNYNGKVIFKFRCYKVEEICNEEYGYSGVDDDESYDWYFTKTLDAEELQEKSCLKRFEIANYLQEEIGTAIHINDLEIFDKPKELNEFEHEVAIRDTVRGYIYDFKKLSKAPQSWCYVEV